ncbi:MULTISPECIES: DUF3846 domain-containing protein [Arthrobacter]|uniref:DUF3846 domain-containing protein n=1 Tax=Arthrobacter TaxID=1663 RepID=UPI001404E592|nr:MULTISPECIES: DUF3846 domain-containing protein [Arthrobacter]MBT8161457.1 DUF3846 domain-containing protein [Arthrobacter sp. GN70]
MISAILIPADEETPISLIDIDGLRDMQRAVGGLIEVMDIDRPDATLVINEEGKLISLPMNRRATLACWTHLSRWRGMDALLGDVIIVGRPNDDGDTTSVPDELVNLFFHTETYRIEVTTISDPDTWSGNQRRFTDVWEAYNAGQVLAHKWALVDDVRVVPA